MVGSNRFLQMNEAIHYYSIQLTNFKAKLFHDLTTP